MATYEPTIDTHLKKLHTRKFSAREFLTQCNQIQNSIGENSPRIVYVQFYVWTVSEISTVDQTFKVLINLKLSFHETNKDNIIWGKSEPWSQEDFKWHPQFRLLNCVEETMDREEWWRVTTKDFQNYLNPKQESVSEAEDIWVHQNVRLRGQFEENMELKDFPFDHQHLHVTLTSRWSADSCIFRLSPYQKSCVSKGALNHQVLSLHEPRAYDYTSDHDDGCLPLLSDPSESNSNVQYNRIHIALVCTRNPYYVLTNVVTMHFLVGTTCFTTFALEADDIADRINLLVTLILATAAFKYVSTTMLPETNYISVVDTVGYGVMCIEFTLCILQSILPHACSEDQLSVVDNFMFLLTACSWVALLVWFFWTCKKLLKKRQKYLQKLADLYDSLQEEIKSAGMS
mmetsp:Transcript_39554/g.51051  ORF Transcript_39554/g.51051 Transcript_39554/m.51051 type:complete len:401 (-) Transcript_39554:1625-2827(-)